MARFIARPTWPFPPFHIGHLGQDQRKHWEFGGFKVSPISNLATPGQVENPTGFSREGLTVKTHTPRSFLSFYYYYYFREREREREKKRKDLVCFLTVNVWTKNNLAMGGKLEGWQS